MKRKNFIYVVMFLIFGFIGFINVINFSYAQKGQAPRNAKSVSKMITKTKTQTQKQTQTKNTQDANVTKVKPKTSQMQRSLSNNIVPSASRAPARDPNAPIEVHGQARNLNMLLILQNPNEEINFVKPRTEYRKEIENMNY